MSQEERKSQDAGECVSTANGASPPRTKGGMTRRKMLTVTAAGGTALALSGIAALHQWISDDQLVVTIEGPFEDYGYLPAERWGFEETDSFRLRLIKFDADRHKDVVFVRFCFKGEEDPDRVMDVVLSVFAKCGRCVARRQESLRDPRIEAKQIPTGVEELYPGITVDWDVACDTVLFPATGLTLDLPKGMRLRDIASLQLEIGERREAS